MEKRKSVPCTQRPRKRPSFHPQANLSRLSPVSLPPRRRCPNPLEYSAPLLKPSAARARSPHHAGQPVPAYLSTIIALPMTRTNGASAGGGQQASGNLPRKRFYRARAHSNPLSDSHFPVPVSPDEFDLSQHYPRYFPADKGGDEAAAAAVAAPRIHFADVGCGFGGLLVGLSPLFPDTLMIGMELRDKVMISCSP
jgi:hypothetical protein